MTHQEPVELKPCPFCGGKASVTERIGVFSAAVMCGNAKCAVHPEVFATKADEAAARWNTRPSPPVEQMGEVLRDWVSDAAFNTLLDAGDVASIIPCQDPSGQTIEHAFWMLDQVKTGDVAGRKAHRWLGYAQALLVRSAWLTLERAKLANKKASDEAPPLPIGVRNDALEELIGEMWQRLLDVDDRTSPEEYPDHALINFDEFKAFIVEAALKSVEGE